MTSKKFANLAPSNCRPDLSHVVIAWLVLLIVLVALIVGPGCETTVRPEPVPAGVASFDGNEQNSGIVMSVAAGFVVTSHFRERLNALIAVYGGDFVPALKPDHGIAPIGVDRWLLSKQAMVDFLEMNAWRRAGLAAKNK